MTVRSDFAASEINRLLRNLTTRIRQTLRSANADAVHDLRVSIRRFDQALLVFGDLLDKKAVRKTRRRLKEIMALAGAVRNCDIAEQLLARQFSGVGKNIRTQRASANKSLAAALSDWIDEGYSSALSHELQIADGSQRVNVRLRTMTEDFIRYGAKAVKSGSPEALHRFRIAAKHYRYTLELLAPIVGRRTAIRHLNVMKAVQSRLGNVNDCETVRVMAADWGVAREVDKFLKKKERRQMERFREEWKRQFADPKLAERWVAELRTARHSSE